MKKKIAGLLILVISLVSSSFVQPATCNLTVVITGLRNNDGQLMVSLNKGSEGFPDENYFLQNYYPKFNSPVHTIVLKNVPYGNYAFSLLHDENMSGEMDYNWIGIPKEGFGFSRNYHVVLRAPKYEEANFEIDAEEMTIEVEMQY